MSLIERVTTGGGGGGSGVNPLAQVVAVFARYVDAKPHYLVGLALWALHTHVYMQYEKSPRLAVRSPVKNCGKSTVLDILGAMAWNAKQVVDPTAASTFRLANSHTLLLDEVDNMSIIKSMRSVLNAGHVRGGSVTRTGKDGEVISYPVYGPVALAGIGRLPATLMSRSLVIRLHRSTLRIERFVPREEYYASQLYTWAEQANLSQNPRLPAKLVGRDADKWRLLIAIKWRPLIAIADSFGQGEIARGVALDFLNDADTPDIKESVLRDTQKMFSKGRVKILTADDMYEKLQADKDGEFEIDYIEQKVTKRAMGNILADFQIRSRPHRYKGDTPKRC
jgi:Protein of unknown function (DUF3631)